MPPVIFLGENRIARFKSTIACGCGIYAVIKDNKETDQSYIKKSFDCPTRRS